MPGVTAKSMKKGVSHIAQVRKEANSKIVKSAVEGELEGCTFGRVVKMLGGGQVQVLDMDKQLSIGIIRGLFRRRGVTPIGTNDIVIMSARDFEAKAAGKKRTYDIVGIADGAAASALEKSGHIPSWMRAAGDVAAGGAGAAADGIEFDYTGGDSDVDVDKI
jgi:translation initiation factor IF-1